MRVPSAEPSKNILASALPAIGNSKKWQELLIETWNNEVIRKGGHENDRTTNDRPLQETGNICLSSISGKFGVGHFELSTKEYGDAWQYMYQEWLFKDERKVRDAVPFELYVTEPPRNSKEKSLTDIYIPINWKIEKTRLFRFSMRKK